MTTPPPIPDGNAENLLLRCRQDPRWAAHEIKRLRTAMAEIAAFDSGMAPDFSNAAKQAEIARAALRSYPQF